LVVCLQSTVINADALTYTDECCRDFVLRHLT